MNSHIPNNKELGKTMNLLKIGAFILISAASHLSFSTVLVDPSIMAESENGVFMDNGRYFVAGSSGIQEVKSYTDNSSNCQQDSSGKTVCTLVEANLNGNQCFYSSLTTDNYYLYATCTVWKDGLLGTFQEPEYAAFLRILPGSSQADQVIVHEFDQPVWYNGMTMLDNDSILMTQSVSSQGSGNSAIVKLDITNQLTADFTISDWLPSSIFYLNPNGVKYENGYVYFVGGQNLFRIPVRWNQTAGIPILMYQTTVNEMLDDFTIVGDWLAIAEVALINGTGTNNVTFVHKHGWISPFKVFTGFLQLSSLAVDPGTLTYAGDLIGTSYYQGGLYRIPMP